MVLFLIRKIYNVSYLWFGFNLYYQFFLALIFAYVSFKKIQKKIATNFKRVSDGKVSTNIVVMIVSFRKNKFY